MLFIYSINFRKSTKTAGTRDGTQRDSLVASPATTARKYKCIMENALYQQYDIHIMTSPYVTENKILPQQLLREIINALWKAALYYNLHQYYDL